MLQTSHAGNTFTRWSKNWATLCHDKRKIWHLRAFLHLRAKFHVYGDRIVGTQSIPKLSKFGILPTNLPLRDYLFAHFLTKFLAYVHVSISRFYFFLIWSFSGDNQPSYRGPSIFQRWGHFPTNLQ